MLCMVQYFHIFVSPMPSADQEPPCCPCWDHRKVRWDFSQFSHRSFVWNMNEHETRGYWDLQTTKNWSFVWYAFLQGHVLISGRTSTQMLISLKRFKHLTKGPSLKWSLPHYEGLLKWRYPQIIQSSWMTMLVLKCIETTKQWRLDLPWLGMAPSSITAQHCTHPGSQLAFGSATDPVAIRPGLCLEAWQIPVVYEFMVFIGISMNVTWILLIFIVVGWVYMNLCIYIYIYVFLK